MKESIPRFFSAKYNDIYFTPDDPESEKQFVFIEANRIGERMASTVLPDGDPKTGRSHRESDIFTVAELGFGFGLNCALTQHAAIKADCSRRLRYFSVEESFPPQDEIKALADKLKVCREEYLGLWARPFSEQAAIHIHEGSAASFVNMDFLADVWYFDGFSPAKNPDMWSAEVFARAFALTRPGGTFSTYTSAGWVRRNLEAAGFIVNRVRGYGNKREMLTGFKPPAGAHHN